LAHGVTNQNKNRGKRAARERLREQRERDRAADRRRRMLNIGGVMVAVLAVAGGVGAAVANKADGDGDHTDARPVVQGEDAAPATLTVYEDFRCPACRSFEEMFRGTVHELEDAGKLRTEYHLVTIIDGNMGGSGSATAANAALCARDQGKFRPYHDVLFSNQPEEQVDAYADTARLTELARKVDGLDNAAFRSCVKNATHAARVADSSAAFLESGHNATPTVLLDGKDVFGDPGNPLTPEKLVELVENKA
jgi:protein-disulfide isomerase